MHGQQVQCETRLAVVAFARFDEHRHQPPHGIRAATRQPLDDVLDYLDLRVVQIRVCALRVWAGDKGNQL